MNRATHTGLGVLTMRDSMHDKDIHEFRIDGKPIHIDEQFRNVTGILTGNPMQIPQREIEQLDHLCRVRDNS